MGRNLKPAVIQEQQEDGRPGVTRGVRGGGAQPGYASPRWGVMIDRQGEPTVSSGDECSNLCPDSQSDPDVAVEDRLQGVFSRSKGKRSQAEGWTERWTEMTQVRPGPQVRR